MIFHPSLKKISSYLDNQLTQTAQTNVKKHLDECEKCRKKVEILELSGSFLQVPEKMKEADSSIFLDGIQTEKLDTQSEIVGEVKSVVGKVIVRAGTHGNELEAFPGCALRKGDTLLTIGDSKALVEWKDGSQIYINKNTELDFQTSAYPLTLRLGEIFSMMQPQRERFEIQTPAAVLSVIGTDFDTEVNKEKQTILRVIKGKVAFKNKTGEVVVKKDKQVEAAEYTKPTVIPIQQKQNVGNWTKPMKPIQNKTGAIMKKLVILILVIAIGVVGYFAYQYFTGTETKVTAPQVQSPELPAMAENVSKEPLNYKQKWNVGEKRVTRMEINSETDTQGSNNQPPMKMKQQITEDIALTTVSTRSEGGYAVDFQIDWVKMEMDMNNVKTVFDSNSESTSQMDKQVGNIWRAIVGKKLTMMLGADGKLESVSGVQELLDEIKTSAANKLLASTFNEGYFKGMMEGFCEVSTIPQRPIQIGESWPISKEMDVPMLGKIKMDSNYTFTGWKEYEGVTCALLNFTGNTKTTSASSTFGPGMLMDMNIKDSQYAGFAFVDPVKGVITETSINQNMVFETTITMPGKGGTPKTTKTSMTLKQQVKSKIISIEQVGEVTPSMLLTDTTTPAVSDTTSIIKP
jgi:hypothetical protein